VIQAPTTDLSSLSKLWTWLRAVAVQFVVAEALSFFCGWLPEVKFSRYLINTSWEPYSPAITCAAFALGCYLSPVIFKMKGAASTWIIGVLWRGYGFLDMARNWSSTWSSQPSRWAEASINLFGKTEQCGATECLGELMFTAPCAVAMAYSMGAITYICWQRVIHPAKDVSRLESL
jgi:hypothetical protein